MTTISGASQQSNYPLIAVRDGIVFPSTENFLIFGRDKSVMAINEAAKRNSEVVLLMQKNSTINDPKKEDLYEIGVLAKIQKIVKGDQGEVSALVKGLKRVRVTKFIGLSPMFEVEIEDLKETGEETEEAQALIKLITNELKNAVSLGKGIDFVFLMNILSGATGREFSDQIAMILDLKPQEKQALLEELDLLSRLKKQAEYIANEVKILEIEKTIAAKTQKKFDKGMKEAVLREKLKTIEQELGEGEGDDKDIREYREKIKKANMPKQAEEKAFKELKRLSKMSQYNPETSYIRTFLDWLVELPWNIRSNDNVDIKVAEDVLNSDHFGLKKVKERILEYLAVLKLKKAVKKASKAKQPTILCFVGPPGVGKTSLGKSIAKALGRKFVKMSLGGIKDEAEVRGHRRTYVGALPGRIIQGIKQSGTKNPVFMLDEIDKIGADYKGDPSAALLEALDPEQNHAFSDHYLEVDFDLSDVIFLTTANILDTIPDALLDRLEVIHFPGYTEDEKFHIAKNYLVGKQVDASGLLNKKVEIEDEALRVVIRRYTREAGVRNLERQVAQIFRKVAREFVENNIKSQKITSQLVQKYLGPFKYPISLIEDRNYIGISTGLAWTQAGGDILFIEVAIMPGKGALTLTGHLGNVMKESCQAALSYIRSKWKDFGLKEGLFQKIDIHVHVPEGAVPKDGPSAGGAITTAMISALTKIPVNKEVGMTGEMTLRGRITEIGGIKEKVIAAHRAGIKTVIMPKENKKDLEELPDYVLKDLKLVFVDHIDQVLNEALVKKISKIKK